MPRGHGVLKVLEYLASMVDYESCVQEALSYLLELSKSEGGLNLDPRYDICKINSIFLDFFVLFVCYFMLESIIYKIKSQLLYLLQSSLC